MTTAGTILLLAVLAFICWRVARGRVTVRGDSDEPTRPHVSAEWVSSRLKALAEPSLLLLPTETAAFSKLGGYPELPPDLAWPTAPAFLGQIDLAEARAAGGPDWLPDRGRLFFFCDPQAFGDAGQVRVLHSVRPAEHPPPRGPLQPYPERRIALSRVISIPNLEWIGLEHHHLDDNEPAVWEELKQMVTSPPSDDMQHRLGGYPNEIQDEQMALICERLSQGLPHPNYELEVTPELERAADIWRLLLQVDSDPGLKMKWGNSGRLYVLIRMDDARCGDFSKTVTLSQSY